MVAEAEDFAKQGGALLKYLGSGFRLSSWISVLPEGGSLRKGFALAVSVSSVVPRWAAALCWCPSSQVFSLQPGQGDLAGALQGSSLLSPPLQGKAAALLLAKQMSKFAVFLTALQAAFSLQPPVL